MPSTSTPEKVYSSLDCGCYYEPSKSDEWVLCKRHQSWLSQEKAPAKPKVKRKRKSKSQQSWHPFKSYSPVRNFSLYVVQLTNDKYYVGITAYKDPMRRIRQHGDIHGARWAFGHRVKRVVEIRRLGKMPKVVAEDIENDVTLQYMKEFGMQNVRGGRNTKVGWMFSPKYNSGSLADILQNILLIALAGILIYVLFLISTSR